MKRSGKKHFGFMVKILLVLMMCFAVGCGDKNENNSNGSGEQTQTSKDALIGEWKGIGNSSKEFITFKKDGSYNEGYDGEVINRGSYSVNESNQTVTCTEKDYGMTFEYHFTLDGDNLTIQLSNGLPRTFQK